MLLVADPLEAADPRDAIRESLWSAHAQEEAIMAGHGGEEEEEADAAPFAAAGPLSDKVVTEARELLCDIYVQKAAIEAGSGEEAFHASFAACCLDGARTLTTY